MPARIRGIPSGWLQGAGHRSAAPGRKRHGLRCCFDTGGTPFPQGAQAAIFRLPRSLPCLHRAALSAAILAKCPLNAGLPRTAGRWQELPLPKNWGAISASFVRCSLFGGKFVPLACRLSQHPGSPFRGIGGWAYAIRRLMPTIGHAAAQLGHGKPAPPFGQGQLGIGKTGPEAVHPEKDSRGMGQPCKATPGGF